MGTVFKLGSVLAVEHLCHVQAVQPHLIGVDGLVPEVALVGSGLAQDLTIEGFDGLAVLFLTAHCVHIKQDAAFADIVQIVVFFLKAPQGAVLENIIIKEVFSKFIVSLLAGNFVHVQQGDHHAAVDIIPAVDLALCDLFNVPQGLIRGGLCHDPLYVPFDLIHSSITSSTFTVISRSPS